MSIYTKNTLFFCILLIFNTTKPLASTLPTSATMETIATFGTITLAVAALRTAVKMGHTIAVDAGCDPRDVRILQSRIIETRFGKFKLHVRKCLTGIALVTFGLYVAKRTGSKISQATRAGLYGAAIGSSMLIGR